MELPNLRGLRDAPTTLHFPVQKALSSSNFCFFGHFDHLSHTLTLLSEVLGFNTFREELADYNDNIHKANFKVQHVY
jgi:hypothetical protein